jgi:hypothetical protein
MLVPFGISIFQSEQEFESCMKSVSELNHRFARHEKKVRDAQKEDERISKEKISVFKLAQIQDEIPTPLPGSNHTFCGICEENYGDFKKHVSSSLHKASVLSNDLFLKIDEEIEDLN